MKNPKNLILRRYTLCLFCLLLLFAAVFGTVRAKENSDFARSGQNQRRIVWSALSERPNANRKKLQGLLSEALQFFYLDFCCLRLFLHRKLRLFDNVSGIQPVNVQ